MFAIPFRQVHLDFHTSERIPIQLPVPQQLRSLQSPLAAIPLPMARSRDTVATSVPELPVPQIVVFNY